MSKRFLIAGLWLAGALGGCSEAPQTTAEPADVIAPAPGTTTGAGAIDACALLTAAEIESVQGAAPASTKPSGKSDKHFSVSQCFFALPAESGSITLRVVQRAAGAEGRDPKQAWQETFGKSVPDAASQKNERHSQRVEGVGEEALWLGDLKTGGLYVLKGNSYIRIGIGGQDDLETKIKKSTALAQMVLPRL